MLLTYTLPPILREKLAAELGESPILGNTLSDIEFSLSYYLTLKQTPPANFQGPELHTLQALQNSVPGLLNQLDGVDPRSLLSLRDGFYFTQRKQYQPDVLKRILEKLKNFPSVTEYAIDDIKREWHVDPDTYQRVIAQIKTVADHTQKLALQFSMLSMATVLLLYEHLIFNRTPSPRDYFESFKSDLSNLGAACIHAEEIVKRGRAPLVKEEQLWSRLFAICEDHQMKANMPHNPFEPIATLIQTLSGLDIERDDKLIKRIINSSSL